MLCFFHLVPNLHCTIKEFLAETKILAIINAEDVAHVQYIYVYSKYIFLENGEHFQVHE